MAAQHEQKRTESPRGRGGTAARSSAGRGRGITAAAARKMPEAAGHVTGSEGHVVTMAGRSPGQRRILVTMEVRKRGESLVNQSDYVPH